MSIVMLPIGNVSMSVGHLEGYDHVKPSDCPLAGSVALNDPR